MAAGALDAATEAANLALKFNSAASNIASFVVELSKDLPWVSPVLKTLESIGDKVDIANCNRRELAVLQERCTYVTACVVVKCRHSASSSSIDVSPLENRLREVQDLVERCGRRGRIWRVVRADDDKRDIDELHGRIGDLTGDMGLVGIVAVEGKVADLQQQLESLAERHQGHHEEQMAQLRQQTAQLVRLGYIVTGTRHAIA